MPAQPPFSPSPNLQTLLPFLDELAFRQWVSENGVPFDVTAKGPTDYDMRGYYRSLMEGQPMARPTTIDPNDNRPHFTDYFKTPLHETFSNESQFASADAPHWNDKDQLVTVGGRILFDDRAKMKNNLLKMLMQGAQ